MINEKLSEQLNEIIKNLPKHFDFGNIGQDLKENLHAIMLSVIRKLDLVTREEFEVQQKVLLATRKKLDELEAILNKLAK